jgi:hypothetical protein
MRAGFATEAASTHYCVEGKQAIEIDPRHS